MNINSRTSKINFTGFASDAIASFTGLREAPIKLRAYINAIQEGSGDPAPDNIRPISGRDSITITANSVDYDISLGDTIYGGILDVTTGVLTVTWKSADLSELGYTKTQSGLFLTISLASSIKKADSGSVASPYIKSSHFKAIDSQSITGPQGSTPSSNGVMAENTSGHLYFNYTDVTTVDDFKAAMQSVNFIYELATPITVQLTPTQIYQIIGSNSISSDSGNVEVYYVTI